MKIEDIPSPQGFCSIEDKENWLGSKDGEEYILLYQGSRKVNAEDFENYGRALKLIGFTKHANGTYDKDSNKDKTKKIQIVLPNPNENYAYIRINRIQK